MLFNVFCQWIVSGLVQFSELRYCYWGTEPIVCWHWFVVRVPETTVRSEGLPWWGNSHAALATFRGRRHSSCWDVTFLGNVFPETTLQRRPVESFTFYGRVFLGVQFSSCREGVRKDWFFSQLWTASHSDLSDEDYAVWVYTGGSSPLLPAMHAILGLRKLLGTFSDVKTLAGVFSGFWWSESILEFSHCQFLSTLETIPTRLNNFLTAFSKFLKNLP